MIDGMVQDLEVQCPAVGIHTFLDDLLPMFFIALKRPDWEMVDSGSP